jgi:hypothetical protein
MHVDVVPGSKGDRYQDALQRAGFPRANLQACLNLMPTTKHSPAFVCAAMNEKELVTLRARVAQKTHGGDKKDMYTLQPDDIKDFGIRTRYRHVNAPAGSLVLWKSELPHANSRGDPGAYKHSPPCDPSRCGVMMCFGPAALQSAGELSRKLDVAQKGWSHDHWPCHATGNGNNFCGLGSNHNKFTQNAAAPLTPEQLWLMGVRSEELPKSKRQYEPTIAGDGVEVVHERKRVRSEEQLPKRKRQYEPTIEEDGVEVVYERKPRCAGTV